MSNEATSLVMHSNGQNYKTASTLETIVAAIQDITTTGPQQIALVTLSLQFTVEDARGSRRRQLVAQSTQYYLEELRRLVRKTDGVYLLDSTFYFLLLGANKDGGSIVENRLWDALLWCVHNADEGNILRPRVMTIGHGAYSIADRNIQTCIDTANEACYSFDTCPETDSDYIEPSQEDDTDVMNATEEALQEGELTALARKLGVPYLSLLPRKKPEQVQRLVTLKLAHELQCYPLGRERGTLTVALSNPQDTSTIARLHKETGLRIFPVLTHPQELQTALSQLF